MPSWSVSDARCSSANQNKAIFPLGPKVDAGKDQEEFLRFLHMDTAQRMAPEAWADTRINAASLLLNSVNKNVAYPF